MKKIKTIAAIILTSVAFMFTGCMYNTPGAYYNTQPYPTQYEAEWSEYACGAFSMAYYLAEQGYIPSKKISSKAKSIYKKIIFPESSDLYPYSDPREIRKVISKYASNAELRMNKAAKNYPREHEDASKEDRAQLLLCLLARDLGVADSEIKDAPDFAAALGKNEYAIEIVCTDPGVVTSKALYGETGYITRNTLHYVLTYWKGNTLYTLDPGRGLEQPRANFYNGTTESWTFCQGGIFITPEN